MNYIDQRRQTLLRNLKKDSLDAILIANPVNVTYLTGFTGEATYYIATAKNAVLVSDPRFEEQLKEECPDLDAHIRAHNKTTLEAAVDVLGKAGAKAVGVEGNHLTIGDLEAFKAIGPKLTFVPLMNMVESQRTVKDPSELERMREAVKVAERAYGMLIATIRETDTEKDMVDSLESFVRRAGGRASSFPPIVAVGERRALPHATPTGKTLVEGSKLLIDWGADLIYKSDITRTIRSPFDTPPSRKNKFERTGYNIEKIHNIVLAAQTAAIAATRDGVAAKEVDAAARKVIAASGYGDYFTHGLGHGIGLEVHEAPRVRANSDDVLEAGMVITLEPAIYIPGWGGVRIEDEVLVTRDSCTLLTTLPRDLPPQE